MDALRIFLIFCFFVVLTLIGWESVRRGRVSTLVSTGQFRLRIFIAFIMLLEVTLIFIATYAFADMEPLVQLFFLSGCLLLAIILIIAALIDVRGVLVSYLLERRRILREVPKDRRHD